MKIMNPSRRARQIYISCIPALIGIERRRSTAMGKGRFQRRNTNTPYDTGALANSFLGREKRARKRETFGQKHDL